MRDASELVAPVRECDALAAFLVEDGVAERLVSAPEIFLLVLF